MKKTILSVLLALAMVICLAAFTAPEAKAADTDPILFHCVCGNKHSTALADGEITWKEGTSACYEGCDGAILEWTAWNANSTTNGGNYYLIANATTKRGLNKDVVLNIDMNGYKWEVANNRGCDVSAGTINICNTRTTGGSIAGYGADAKSPNGIAMNQWGGNLTLYGIDVMGIAGNAAISHGGAIYHSAGSLKMVGGSITGAPVTTLGGALRIESKGNVTLQNVTVTGAAAQNGGAISTNGKLTMTGCTVTGANTSNVAAALHVGSGSATIVDTTLTGATAKGNGGTICVVDGSLTMTGGSVTGGICDGTGKSGGNIYILDGKTASFENVIISGGNCVKATGGNIYAGKGSNLTLTNCTVTGGSTLSHGGNIYTAGTLTVTGGSISGGSNSMADRYGGNIYAHADANVALTNVTVSDGNCAGKGGNIYSAAPLSLTNCTVSGGISAADGGNICVEAATGSLTIEGGSVTGGQGTYGGNICVTATVKSVEVKDAIIAEGKAKNNGGNFNIFNKNVATIKFTDCTIYGGEADTDGGNLWIGSVAEGVSEKDNTVILYDCIIYGGTADKAGSVMVARRTAFQSGSVGYDAEGKSAGGVASINGGNIFINNCDLVLNLDAKVNGGVAEGNGGNIYMTGENALLHMNSTSSVTFGLSKATVENDSAINATKNNIGGGNLFINNGSAYMIDKSAIHSGDAYACGGNVCIYNGYLQMGDESYVAGGGYTGIYGSGTAITYAGGNIFIGANGKLQMIDTAHVRNAMCRGQMQGANIQSYGVILLGGESEVYGGIRSGVNRNIHCTAGSLTLYKSAKVDGGITISGTELVLMEKPTIACYRTDKDGNVINSGRTIYLGADTMIDASALFNGANVQLFDLAIPEGGRQIATISEDSDNSVRTRIAIAADSTQLAGYKITRERNADGVVGLYLRNCTTVGVRESAKSVVDYLSMEAALAAAGEKGTIVLYEDMADVAIAQDIIVDLNGNDLTNVNLAEGVTLWGIDTTTDDYDCADGYGVLTLAEGSLGAVEGSCKTNGKQYVTLADANGKSFHRIYVAITKLNLVPSATAPAFGYKAVFAGDQMVQANLDETAAFGYTLGVDGIGRNVTFSKGSADFVNKAEVTLRLENYDVAGYAETDVIASTFITVAGQRFESAQCSYSLKDLVQAVNKNAASYSQAQITALQNMINAYDVMKNWDETVTGGILNWTAPVPDEE